MEPEPKQNLDDAAIRRLASIDLNLLVVFSALMDDRSVTLAAQRLFVGQPAVSASLKRLRAVFGNPLFVKEGRGLVATQKALELHPLVRDVLAQIDRMAFKPPPFDPALAKLTIKIGFSDDYEIAFLPEIIGALSQEAPQVRLLARPVSHTDVCDRLDSSDVDVAISVFGDLRPWHRSQVLYEQGYGCLFDPAQWGKDALSLDDYLGSRQLIVTFDGALTGKIDRVLDGLGLQRNVGLGTTRFATLPYLVKGSRLVASLPELIGRRLASTHALAYCPLAFQVPPGLPRMAWHSRNDTDPVNIWLRGLVQQCVEKVGAGFENADARRAPKQQTGR